MIRQCTAVAGDCHESDTASVKCPSLGSGPPKYGDGTGQIPKMAPRFDQDIDDYRQEGRYIRTCLCVALEYEAALKDSASQ